jgi:hypothetical protein
MQQARAGPDAIERFFAEGQPARVGLHQSPSQLRMLAGHQERPCGIAGDGAKSETGESGRVVRGTGAKVHHHAVWAHEAGEPNMKMGEG